MCAVSLFQRLFLWFGSVVIIVRGTSSCSFSVYIGVVKIGSNVRVHEPCFEVKWFLFGLQKLLWWFLLLHSIIIELSSCTSVGFLLPWSMFFIGITGKVSRSKQMALIQLKLLHGKHTWSFNASPSISLRSSCLQTKEQPSYYGLQDIFAVLSCRAT